MGSSSTDVMVDGKDYRCIFVDAQLILHRNWCMVSKYNRDKLFDENGEVNCPPFLLNNITSAVINSFMYSVRKILRAYSTHKIILLWDRQPYHNAELIKDRTSTDSYKSDRTYEYDEAGELLFKARQNAKYHIIDNYEKFGIPSIIYKGYEADYLGRIAATLVTEKSALASYDSDWTCYMTENCPELINTRNFSLTYYSDVVKDLKMDPWEWQKYYSAFFGSHNNLLPTISESYKSAELETMMKLWADGDYEAFSDVNLLRAQLDSWDYKLWDDYPEVEKLILDKINAPVTFASSDEWVNDLNTLGLKYYDEIKQLLS
jgi:hypothetical protein